MKISHLDGHFLENLSVVHAQKNPKAAGQTERSNRNVRRFCDDP